MRIIASESTDIHFHLAAEAYLLHEQNEDVLMIWRSDKAVVCGKHQNVCAEINYYHCHQTGVKIARRLSGGGTVFHDLGNVNFTFIKALTEGMERAVDYKRYLEPVREVLLEMGIETTYSDRDDLLLRGFKISGNAQHIYQKGLKALHHGTLLYDANLSNLGDAIHSRGHYVSKGVPSNRSQVTNIRDWHDLGDTAMFTDRLIAGFERKYGTVASDLSLMEQLRCEAISQEKFENEDWILGYSPRYSHVRHLFWKDGTWNLNMEVYQDKIESMRICDRSGNLKFTDEINALIGKSLRLDRLREVFEGRPDEELLQLF
jgi:lipoate-protein ligase A